MNPNKCEIILRRLALKVAQQEPEMQNAEAKPTIGRLLKKGGGIAWKVSKEREHEQVAADFWKRVAIGAPDECWPWMAGRNDEDGYGTVWIYGHKLKTSRVAYALHFGESPGTKLVCHSCDNPPCCNPQHFFLGTHKDNAQDCVSKGRNARAMGSDRYNAKLTEEQVERIKREAPSRRYGWGRSLAREFGVCPSAINNIVKGRRWKQVTV